MQKFLFKFVLYIALAMICCFLFVHVSELEILYRPTCQRRLQITWTKWELGSQMWNLGRRPLSTSQRSRHQHVSGVHICLCKLFIWWITTISSRTFSFPFFIFKKKLSFFFGLGGSCRRSVVECIGNYINHSWSLLASYQWGICNWVYIGSNYRECQLTPYDFVLFTRLRYFRLFDDGIAPWRHDTETKTPKRYCHCVNNLSITVVCTTVIFCTSPNVFAFIGGPGGVYYWTKEILSSI